MNSSSDYGLDLDGAVIAGVGVRGVLRAKLGDGEGHVAVRDRTKVVVERDVLPELDAEVLPVGFEAPGFGKLWDEDTRFGVRCR